MKKETVKKLLLPIGLLVMAAGYFSNRFISSDVIPDFILGLGLAFVLSALFFISRARLSANK